MSGQPEETLVLVKPNGVYRNLIGDILARFQHRGLSIEALEWTHCNGQHKIS